MIGWAGLFCLFLFTRLQGNWKNQRKDKLDNSKIMPFSVYRADKMA